MWSVFADGSSSGGSNKPGGYGFVVVQNDGLLQWGYGGTPATTNNLMEMEGLLQGILTVVQMDPRQEQDIELVSDSQYALGIASGRYSPTKNLEEAARLRAAAQLRRFTFRWVKGHAGEKWNEAADMLAKQGKLENTPADQRKTPRPKPRREEKARRKTKSLTASL